MVLVMMVVIMVIIILIVLVLARIMTVMMHHFVMLGDAFEVRLELALALALRQRTELHVDVTTRHARILIHMAHGEKVFLDLLRELMPELLMRHLAATELKLDAHLVAFRQEVFGVRDLDQVVMRVDADAEFHFLHLAALLVLVSLLLVLLLDVLVLPVVDDFAHGWIGVRRHFHKVQPALFGDADGLCRRQDAKLMMPVLLNNTHLRRTNALIDACLIDKTTVRAIPATGTITTAAWAERSTTARSLIAACWTRGS